MKQKLLLLVALFCYFIGYAQVNPSYINHYVIDCDEALIDSGCNLIPNHTFRSTGDSLEDFSDGAVYMWQDINNLTTDINAALAPGNGWNTPTLPSNLLGINFASMLVDNLNVKNEGIAAKIFPIVSGNKYAMSFFLASSALTGYRTSNGRYTFKIFLTHCQNFDSTSANNPNIEFEDQLIFCKSIDGIGDSSWRQYFITFTADNNYNMIVIFPEVPVLNFNGGNYVHFLYPQLIPINPKSQYLTYTNDEATEGYTVLSACGVINASYEWSGPNGVVSNKEFDILDYDTHIGETDEYDFSMWVEGSMGNYLPNCRDNESIIIEEHAERISTVERITCSANVVPTSSCNIIPNATFDKIDGSVLDHDAFRRLNGVQYWGSVNGGSPDLNGHYSPTAPPYPVPSYPTLVPTSANVAGMIVGTGSASYNYEGICAKIPQLIACRKYAFSFFLNTFNNDPESNAADFTFKVVLSGCKQFPLVPTTTSISTPPDWPSSPSPQTIICQRFPGNASTGGFQQYLVTFIADANYNMITAYPEGNNGGTGTSYVYFLYPELIDVTNMAVATTTSSCNYSIEACGVTNATFEWVDADDHLLGTNQTVNVDVSTHPPPYTLTLSVPHILDNPDLDITCGEAVTENFAAVSHENLTTWIGGSSGNETDWNTAANWFPAVVPNDALTDVLIPSCPTDQPTISQTFTNPILVHDIIIEPGALLTNNKVLQIAGEINGNTGSINNYDGADLLGSIEMNGTCRVQTIAGNIFVNNDVKNFTASNDVEISTTTGEGIDVWAELGFGSTSTTLNTGNNLTLISRAASTAYVAQIDNTNDIIGDVTVERYIHTGTGASSGTIPAQHAKKWQFLATPTGSASSGQTIHQSWMEGCTATLDCNPGFGVQLTGTGTGFDISPTAPSIKYWDPSVGLAGDFVGITNTGIQLYDKRGYFVFVRGDRGVDGIFNITPAPTVLRQKGPIYQPSNPPPSSSVGSGYDLSIGNPYASAIDLSFMYSNSGYLTNIDDVFIVWDPSIPGTLGLGGYQYIDAGGGFTPTPGGTGNYYESGNSYSEIQSGQAFFVHASGGTGVVNFNEAVKSVANRLVNRINYISPNQSLRAQLYSNTGICDGTKIIFDNDYSNNIDGKDAKKMSNPGENFMIVKKRDQAVLAIEKRKPINLSDTIFYGFSNLRPISYKLKFTPENLQEKGLHAILVDNYLQKIIDISLIDTTLIDFIIDNNINSYENRFQVIFERDEKQSHENKITADNKGNSQLQSLYKVYPVPVENKTIKIDFVNKASGCYILQLISNAGQIIYKNSVNINDLHSTTSFKLNTNTATGNYNLVITDPDKKITVRQVFIK